MTHRQALAIPAGVWLSLDAARSVAVGLASLESLLRRHRSARLSADLDEVRQMLTCAIDADAAANVNAFAINRPGSQAGRDLVDAVTAAQLLGITPGAVRDRARRGELPAGKVGGRWLVDLSQCTRDLPV